MRILILSPTLPFPADDGGKLRAASVALALAARHQVAFGCFTDPAQDPADRRESADRFWDFKCLPRASHRPGWRRWFSTAPSDVQESTSAEMRIWFEETVARFSPDVLLSGDPALTHYLAPHRDRVRVLDYVCVATLQFERLQAIAPAAERVLWALRRLKFAAYLARVARSYDLCVVNSEEDRTALLSASPDWARVEIVPNGLDLTAYPLGLAVPDPNTLLFHGALTYSPNLDAARHLVHQIFPRVRAAVPEARLLITGRVGADRSAPQGPGVAYTGYVPDIRPVIAGAWACPVPLRTGAGGARFKVLEALALGTPVIATAIAAEGLAVSDGVDILMAEEPAAFAAQTIKVMRSPDLRQRLAEGGRRLIERRYDWVALGERFASLLDDLVSERQRTKGLPTETGVSA